MIHFERTLKIDATPDAVWAVLGNFMQVDEFAPEIVSVDVFYTQDADPGANRDGVVNRFWHHAEPEELAGEWVAELPD